MEDSCEETWKIRRKRQLRRRLIIAGGIAGIALLSCFLCIFMRKHKAKADQGADEGQVAVIDNLQIDAADNQTMSAENAAEELSEEEQAALEEARVQEQSERMQRLDTSLHEYTSGLTGNWSVYVKNLTTDEVISINNQRMYPASLIKIFVMYSVYAHMDQVALNASRTDDPADGMDTIRSLLDGMITYSSNDYYNELIRYHSSSHSFTEGCREVLEFVHDQGYPETGVCHCLIPSSTTYEYIEGNRNYTTAEDCGRLLESIYRGECVSEEASSEMLELLLSQQITHKIPAGVPEGILVANKTGETDEEEHDAAIIFGEKTDYILCVMSSEFSGVYESEVAIQEISELVYDELNS